MQHSLELTQLLDISQQMLSSAETGDWECLPEQEIERKKVMEHFFSSDDFLQDSSPQQSNQVSQVINKVLDINAQIETLAEQEKRGINQQLLGMKQKQNAHSAYLKNE